MNVLWCVVIKEFQQMLRDRRMLPSLIIMPLVQVLALGFAANNDLTNVELLVVDHDRSVASRDLADRFESTGIFDVVGVTDDERLVDGALEEGSARMALVVPHDFGRETAAGRPASVQIIADGSDSSSATVGLGHASRIVTALGAELVAERARTAGLPMREGFSLETRSWYNPELQSRWFYLPGILALVLMLVTMVLPSVAVVREKETGTLEQLAVTPVKPWQLIGGKLVPFALIGVADLCLVTLVVRFVFGVPVRGSFLTLLLFTALFMMNTLGLGLLVSTLVRTTQQAMLASVYALNVPMIYLSGQIFPIENMPHAVQLFTHVVPLRYYNIAVRGIFLKGSGLDALWPEALTLLGLGTFFLGLAVVRFRKSLD